jgi:gamma-glutamylcyclotransferase (GGCT)/AIG2-like uncharacterized protein YtfP
MPKPRYPVVISDTYGIWAEIRRQEGKKALEALAKVEMVDVKNGIAVTEVVIETIKISEFD